MRARTKRIWILLLEEFALLSSELVLVIVLGLISLWGFIFVSHLLINNRVQGFDNMVMNWMSSIQSEGMTNFMLTFTALGQPQIIVVPILLVIIYFLFIKPHRWYAIRIPAVALGTYLLNKLLKYWFDRPRPDEKQRMVEVLYSLSFPSGHAMFAVAFYGLFIFVLWRNVDNRLVRVTGTVLLSVIILLIGISRVYLKVHYMSDVLAGFAAGFLWLVLCLYLINRIEKLIRKREQKKAREDVKTLP